jgi:predicted TIM-barrel fold metal-dependent hydrolase
MIHLTRESPWGPLEVFDAHVHFFSHTFFEKIIAQKNGLTLESAAKQLAWQMPPESPEQFAELWAHELDRHGISGAALMSSIPGDLNSVLAAVRGFPQRFLPFAMVNPREWNAAALEGIRVACLFPAMHRYSIQDTQAQPVLDWAEQGGRAIFVHCGVLSVGIRAKLGLKSQFDMRFSNPLDLQAVAQEHPNVPFIVPHFGAGYFREALMLADLCPNVYFDTSSSNQWMKYQESHLDLRQVFKRTLDVVGPGRLLFGTDSSFFPRGWHHAIFDDQSKALYEIGLSAHDAKLIFGHNLLRIIPPA